MTIRGVVYLVGAGPGHPGLLTLRALDCLRQADLILYDKLALACVLDHAPKNAATVCIADLSESQGQRNVPIHETMIDAARQGKIVVRLKVGDPYLLGRGGEEAQALRKAGIRFEVVSGITAALGAAAFAGIPLTHRQHAGAVAFVTGHENPDMPECTVDWAALAHFPGTLAIYMGTSRLEKIVPTLIQGGKDPSTPAAAVHSVSTGEQHTVTSTLADLPTAVRNAGLVPPAIILIGTVVALRDELDWFEHLPLFGKRILVTRPRHQAGSLVHSLIELGAVPLVLPAVEIRPPADWGPVDRALENLPSYDWLVFTSANGVFSFMNRLFSHQHDLRSLGSIKLAAIGPKTAEALEKHFLRPDVVPATFQSEHLASALLDKVSPSTRVLLARADRGRELLQVELAKRCLVEQVTVYEHVDAIDHGDPVLDQLRRGEIDYVTLTSSNIARALFQNLDAVTRARLESGETRLISISPVTSAEIRSAGFTVAAEAPLASMAGIVQALTELVAAEKVRQSGTNRLA